MAATVNRGVGHRMDAESANGDDRLSKIFDGLFGALLGLALVKFGNPIILESEIKWPANEWDWLLSPWPVVIGYWLLGGVVVAGLLAGRWKGELPPVLVAMPLVWLTWEIIAATQTNLPRFTPWPTVIHFCSCVICFYLGLFSLKGAQRLWPFWAGILAGLFLVLYSGFQQHFGGLEETRKYWLTYIYPTMADVPLDLMKKMATNRIFATLFYPNTLAGVILMLLPATLAVLWSLGGTFTKGARGLLVAIAAAALLACLFWSGSKGGWLLMLVACVVGSLSMPVKRETKILAVAMMLGLGLAGFAVKNLAYFRKGATSVNERFHYWQAALATAREKPVFGSGPGSFSRSYAQRKAPGWEMARLAHNDYLQQASDSGLPGFLAFATLVAGTLAYAWRWAGLREDWIKLAVWLGLLGWALQSLMEFGLYIPAIAWPAFGLMGWLLGQSRNRIDTGKDAG
jgi:putative inorganic carbon (HCO3(-)) transporter